MRVVMVMSGGLDSMVAAAELQHEGHELLGLGFDYGQRHLLGVQMSLSWTCYEGGDVHCGACGACIERREAFQIAGVPDPTTYR